MSTIYLDYNGTTPIDPGVMDSYIAALKNDYGNPASIHRVGLRADNMWKDALSRIKECLNTPNRNSVDNELIVTSGATEGINMILRSYATVFPDGHIITVKTEHKAVIETCDHLPGNLEFTYLDVDSEGLISLKELEESIRPNTCLICVMWVNNETGVIQPIEEIGIIAHQHKIPFMVDGTQAIGRVDVDLEKTPIDYFICSGHKFYAPKGIGLVYQRITLSDKYGLKPLITGGGQQDGIRCGTANSPLLHAFAKALELSINRPEEQEVIRQYRDYFESEIKKVTDVKINGSTSHRSLNTSNIQFEGFEIENIMMHATDLNFSKGSACSSRYFIPSHVLTAMGLTKEEVQRSARFSFGRFTTESDVKSTINSLEKAVQTLSALTISL